MKKVEFVVMDCPIMGKVVVTHYVDELKKTDKWRRSRN